MRGDPPPGLEQARDRQAIARTRRPRRDSRGPRQNQSAHELRPPNRQAQRDRAAERVADDRGRAVQERREAIRVGSQARGGRQRAEPP